jgi:hypothetical protein
MTHVPLLILSLLVKLSSLLTQHIFFVNPLPSTASPYSRQRNNHGGATASLSIHGGATTHLLISLYYLVPRKKSSVFFMCKNRISKTKVEFSSNGKKKKA